MDGSTQNLFNTPFCESYGDSEQIELQNNRKPQLQKKDACYYQDRSLSSGIDMCFEVQSHKCCRHEPCYTRDDPSEDLHWHDREALQTDKLCQQSRSSYFRCFDFYLEAEVQVPMRG